MVGKGNLKPPLSKLYKIFTTLALKPLTLFWINSNQTCILGLKYVHETLVLKLLNKTFILTRIP